MRTTHLAYNNQTVYTIIINSLLEKHKFSCLQIQRKLIIINGVYFGGFDKYNMYDMMSMVFMQDQDTKAAAFLD